MNTNEIPPKADSRMKRIQKFSAVLRTFFRVAAVLAAIGGLVNISCALPVVHLLKPLSLQLHNFVFSGVTSLIWAVGLWLCGKLFMHYARGDLFSPKIVSCIRQIGWVGILKGVMGGTSMFLIMLWRPSPASISLAMAAPMSFLTMLLSIVPGIALICVAWVMDEGRKIQEEQELTV